MREENPCCEQCGAPLPKQNGRGRAMLYCSPTCKKAAYRQRKTQRLGQCEHCGKVLDGKGRFCPDRCYYHEHDGIVPFGRLDLAAFNEGLIPLIPRGLIHAHDLNRPSWHAGSMAALDLALEVTRDDPNVITVQPAKNRGAPVQSFAALWTYEQDAQGELIMGRFYGLGKPEASALSRQEQAELCILKDMTDGMNQRQLVDLVKQGAGIGRHTAIAAINNLKDQGKLYARVGQARGAIAYGRA